nr:putative reverse transcriptase domain-containing protein [Tanacetum cinerariifolium]
MKASELKLEDIPNVRNFPSVFPEDLPGLLLFREVNFRIDLVPEAMPIAKSPYRLAPMKLQELSNNLRSSKTKVSYDLVLHLGELLCCLLKRDMVRSIRFLGHVLNSEGIHVVPAKSKQ